MCCLIKCFDFCIGQVKWHGIQTVVDDRGRNHEEPCGPLCWLCGISAECFPRYTTLQELILKLADKKDKSVAILAQAIGYAELDSYRFAAHLQWIR